MDESGYRPNISMGEPKPPQGGSGLCRKPLTYEEIAEAISNGKYSYEIHYRLPPTPTPESIHRWKIHADFCLNHREERVTKQMLADALYDALSWHGADLTRAK